VRAVVQRVVQARVEVEGETVGAIETGLLIFLGIAATDTELVARELAERIARLRIFAGAGGRLDRSVLDRGGGALVVSQFTLFADARRGHRPNFSAAAPGAVAQPLCLAFATRLSELGVAPVATGRFGAQMVVAAVGDGPVTVVLSRHEAAWDTRC